MALRIVFLDIDGVLNSGPFIREQAETVGLWDAADIDVRKMALLNQILERTGAKVVISSSWRKIYPNDVLEQMLRKRGFAGEIVGHTDELWRTPEGKPLFRGHEIDAWLNDDAPEPVEAFVILDDDSDMVHLTRWLVKTSFEEGLTQDHVERAVEMLSSKDDNP